MDGTASSPIAVGSNSLQADLQAIVTPAHVHAADANDTIAGVQPHFVVAPGTEEELAKVLRLANGAGLSVIPCGGATKLDWGNPPSRADLVLSTSRLDKIVEHAWADMTVTVEAGCTVQNLQNTLAQHGQRLALDALWPERATIGGVLSTNDSGALRLRFGSLRDLIIGVTLALPDGTVAHSGGKVVKNVAGYDLQKLATGALGTLGVITRAIFRLHPIPHHSRTLQISAPTAAEAQRTVNAIQDSKLAHSALQVVLSSSSHPRVDVLLEGTEAGVQGQEEQLRRLIAPLTAEPGATDTWSARQTLYSFSGAVSERVAVAKIAFLPSAIAATSDSLAQIAEAHNLAWEMVLQAIGTASVRFEGNASALQTALQSLRQHLEQNGGSLILQRRPAELASLDAWGSAGDALSLMKAIKMRFDPHATLNPGRFVGGI
jgi:glycolate oxidase FAD binding subunit